MADFLLKMIVLLEYIDPLFIQGCKQWSGYISASPESPILSFHVLFVDLLKQHASASYTPFAKHVFAPFHLLFLFLFRLSLYSSLLR